MLTMNDLKIGSVIVMDNQPYLVNYTQHVQMGRGGAILRTKLKNLVTGQVLEETFKSGDKLEAADLEYKKASFLYRQGKNYFFMDSQTFDQFALSNEHLGDAGHFLKDGLEVTALYFQDRPVSLQLPKKIELTVTQTEPAVRGDTAQGSVTKPAVLETGYQLPVPLFINQGDTIRINTETGKYVERA